MFTGSAEIAEVWNSFSVTIVNSNLWDRYSTVRLESQSPLLSGLLQVTKADHALPPRHNDTDVHGWTGHSSVCDAVFQKAPVLSMAEGNRWLFSHQVVAD